MERVDGLSDEYRRLVSAENETQGQQQLNAWKVEFQRKCEELIKEFDAGTVAGWCAESCNGIFEEAWKLRGLVKMMLEGSKEG